MCFQKFRETREHFSFVKHTKPLHTNGLANQITAFALSVQVELYNH